jgi:hypothetical protein
MMNDHAAPERNDDRPRKGKRGPQGSQRTGSPPPPNGGSVSLAKPQKKGPRKSTGNHRGRLKTGANVDAHAQPATSAFDGVEAQGPQRPRTSGTAEVPGHEEDDDTFPLGDRRKSAQFEAALPDTSMKTEDNARPGAAVAAASLVAPLAQAPVLLPSTTAPLIFAAGGGVSAARALPPVLSEEVIVDMFLASKTEEAAAALLATVVAPSADDTEGQKWYAVLTQIVTTTVDGTLTQTGQVSLTGILTTANLTDESRGLARSNQALVIRFMDPAEYRRKKKKQETGKGSEPKLGFVAWRRGALVKLVEMLASRAAGVVAERQKADADAKWDKDVAAAEALRADLMARKAGDYKPKVLESLAKSATDLQASGRLCHAAVDTLQQEAHKYFPYGGWVHGGKCDGRLTDFLRKLREYAARKPAAEELAAMLDAVKGKQSARMDGSDATRRSVHAAQLAAVADVAIVGARPPLLTPEWNETGRQRARNERAAEESAPESEMGCHLGPLHPCHNAAIAASIRESGALPRRTLEKGKLAENQMFFAVRDVPKPKTPEEMVRSFRANTAPGTGASGSTAVPARRRARERLPSAPAPRRRSPTRTSTRASREAAKSKLCDSLACQEGKRLMYLGTVHKYVPGLRTGHDDAPN